MRFSRLYRFSFGVMLVLSCLVFSIDATEDNRLAMLYPPVVAGACVLTFLTVDRNGRLALPRQVADLLGLATISLSFLEYWINPELLVLALAHWLVYLELVKLFLPKTNEDDWFLFALGLVQVVVGAVMSQSDEVGMLLFLWSLSAIWVLGLFYLRREALRFLPATGAASAPEPYESLVNFAYLWSAARVVMLTLVLGGLVFLVMPRASVMGSSQRTGVLSRHLTGFDDEVKLGQFGEILEDETPVMAVELYNQAGDKIQPDGEPLWRGVTMVRYQGGRWYRSQRMRNSILNGGLPIFPGDRQYLRQVITLEPSDNRTLFVLRPVLDTSAGQSHLDLNASDGSFSRSRGRYGTFQYTVLSAVDTTLPQPGERYPDETRRLELITLPEGLMDQLGPIVQPIVADISEDEPARRARALEAYLRDRGGFTYTLRLSRMDRKLDPVVDFLKNVKAGHCEYYASALTLMLRTAKIPARMVNGFKGGDWNSLGQVLYVRQKHAHTWVEALVGKTPNGSPVWITLDPTPALERDESIARLSGIAGFFQPVTDFVRFLWSFYVVGFNAERQKRILYEPAKELWRDAQRGYTVIWGWVRGTVGRVLHFENPRQFFTVRGFLVSFFGMLLLVGIYRAIAWGLRRLWRWWRGPEDDASALAAGVLFYRRLVQLLAEHGLERPAGETPREFARRAAATLAAAGPEAVGIVDVPRLVVDAFYRVRFGGRDLLGPEMKDLEDRLDALEAHLRPATA